MLTLPPSSGCQGAAVHSMYYGVVTSFLRSAGIQLWQFYVAHVPLKMTAVYSGWRGGLISIYDKGHYIGC